MGIQVLVATMHQCDHSLLKKMNIRSSAIVGNQCDYNSIEKFKYNGHEVTYLNFNERGVGLNRNNALMRATGEICLFADDDVVYEDDYVEKVEKAFLEQPKADVIIFNVKESRNGEPLKDYVTKNRFVGRKGVSSFATFTIGIRTKRIKEKNIVFHRMFGGGAEFSCGEDTIFLQDCINRGLKVYTCSACIGTVFHSESQWFEGYTEKYFVDKGVLYYYLYPRMAKALSLYHVIKHRNLYKDVGIKKAINYMWCGCNHRMLQKKGK